jgi:hypothetical protein
VASVPTAAQERAPRGGSDEVLPAPGAADSAFLEEALYTVALGGAPSKAFRFIFKTGPTRHSLRAESWGRAAKDRADSRAFPSPRKRGCASLYVLPLLPNCSSAHSGQ